MAVRREQVVKTAEKFVARGKIEAAIREYRKVLGDNPNDTTTLNRVGDLYARIERIDEAVELFSQIAENYGKDGFFVKAIAIYKKIIKLDPTRLDAIEHLAELYDRQGLVNEARTQYQVLADYYLSHDNRGSALSAYERMAALEPENPSHHVKLAELYQAQKMTAKAIGAYRTIAELMISHDRPEEAAKVYERALDVDASDVGFITDAVLRLREAGQTGAAAHLLAAAVRLNPEAESVANLVAAEERGEEAPQDTPPSVESGAEDEAEDGAAAHTVESVATTDSPSPVPDGAEDSALQGVPFEDAAGANVADADDDTLYELDLTEEPAEIAEPPATFGEGTPAPPAELAVEAEALVEEGGLEEIDLDLDDVFVLDLDEEDAPASLVQPPADLAPQESPATPASPATEVGPEPESEMQLGPETGSEPVPEPAAVEEPLPELEPLPNLEENFFELDVDDDFSGDDLSEADASPERQDFSLPLASEELQAGAVDEGIDEDFLERTAAELQPVAVRPEEDLFTEAEVLAKYGLEEKAMERLEDVLDIDPQHVGALALLVGFDLEKGRANQVLTRANELASLAAGDEDGPWPEMRERLVDGGYRVKGDQVLAPPPKTPTQVDVGHLLDGLMEEDRPPTETTESTESTEAKAPKAEAPPRPEPRDGSIEQALASLETTFQSGKKAPARPPREEVEVESSDEVAAAATPLEAPEPALTDPSLAESPLAEAPLAEPSLAEASPEAATPDPSVSDSAEEELEDSGVRWLDEVADTPKGETSDSTEAVEVIDDVFEDEDDFFDLAAEIEQELDAEESLTEDIEAPAEPSLEEIVEGFKQGVAENLSPEDYDTHFNLGIAYREMGLLDEAIGEFQLASKDEGHLVECCSMLGLCFLEKGLPDLAVKWYRRGLESKTLSEEDRQGLLYDLGNSYLNAGDFEQAYEVFVDIYGVNSNYRDVVAKLEEIASRRG